MSYTEGDVTWSAPTSIALQIDDGVPWAGQATSVVGPSGGAFLSSVYMDIQRPLIEELRHGTQVKVTANGHTRAFSLSGPVAEMAFSAMDKCVASVRALREMHMPLQKGRAPVMPPAQPGQLPTPFSAERHLG
jgi:hypothetical protein